MRVLIALSAVAAAVLVAASPGAAGPTCSDVAALGIDVHGQHIIRDYVIGENGTLSAWPPSGGVVGRAVAGSGAAVHGGPSPDAHDPFAPGASFCTDSKSPGVHV